MNQEKYRPQREAPRAAQGFRNRTNDRENSMAGTPRTTNGKPFTTLADRACYCRGVATCLTCAAWSRLIAGLDSRRRAFS